MYIRKENQRYSLHFVNKEMPEELLLELHSAIEDIGVFKVKNGLFFINDGILYFTHNDEKWMFIPACRQWKLNGSDKL